MIFLCFSVKDRIPLINDFYHFITNFGLDVWYDRRNIFLGDNRTEVNITKGVENASINYAIIFYSENFKDGNICLEEYEILVNRYNKKEIFLFPVFITNVPDTIDDRFKLCKTLVFKEIKNQNDFPALCLHIIAKITYDEICKLKFKNLKDIVSFPSQINNLYYSLIIEYQNIEKTNYNMRIAFLYALYKCITHNRIINFFHIKTMNFIFHQNCLNILIDEKRELQIMENIIVYELAHL